MVAAILAKHAGAGPLPKQEGALVSDLQSLHQGIIHLLKPKKKGTWGVLFKAFAGEGSAKFYNHADGADKSTMKWFSINFVKEGDVSKVVCTGTQRILKLWHKLLIDAAYKPPGEKFEAWDGKIELKSFNLIKALKPWEPRRKRTISSNNESNPDAKTPKKTSEAGPSPPKLDHVEFENPGAADAAASAATHELLSVVECSDGRRALANLVGAFAHHQARPTVEHGAATSVPAGMGLSLSHDMLAVTTPVLAETKILMSASPGRKHFHLKVVNENTLPALEGVVTDAMPGLAPGETTTCRIAVPDGRVLLDMTPPRPRSAAAAASAAAPAARPARRPFGQMHMLTHDGDVRLAQFGIPLVPCTPVDANAADEFM